MSKDSVLARTEIDGAEAACSDVAAEFIRRIDKASNTRWVGNQLVTTRQRLKWVEFRCTSRDSDTDDYTSTFHYMSRIEAARELRELRRAGAYLHRTPVGYYAESLS